jgi:hypothetical protein
MSEGHRGEATFDPAEILRVLHDHGVEFVVIGGMAAALHGADHITTDIDITPRAARTNLTRLSTALRELDARIRVEGLPDGLVFDHDGESLGRARIWNLTTRSGDLDVSFVPAGTDGFGDLDRHAVTIRLRGVPTRIAALADVVRSKEAADRPKDRLALPTLRRLLAVSEARHESEPEDEQ